jgi:hypothetical protein
MVSITRDMVQPQPEDFGVGGKPSKGTPPDKRLARNNAGAKAAPAKPASKGGRPFAGAAKPFGKGGKR